MKILEAHELALEKVFGGDYSFTIPTYQRPYAWKTDQALQLLVAKLTEVWELA